MKSVLVGLLLSVASITVHADMLNYLSSVANSMIDEPIDTYAKQVVADVKGVGAADFQTFALDANTKHAERTVEGMNDSTTAYTCSTVTADGTDYRLAIRIDEEDYSHISEGEPFYLAICAPHTPQGKAELELINVAVQATKLFQELEQSFGDNINL